MSMGQVQRKTGLISLAFASLTLLGVSACRDHSTVSSAPQPATQQPAQVVFVSADEKSCRQFVQDFYDWYFGRLNLETKKQTSGPTTYEVLSLKPQVLSPELRRMLKEDSDAQARSHDEIVGLDFDPFINAQDWEGSYQVDHITLKDGVCRASVWGTDSGAKREMVDPELKLGNQKWIFVNFHYPGSANPSDENLIDLLNELRHDRQHPTK